MPHTFPFPDGPAQIIHTLEAHGFSAYAVGGCARDLLRGKQPHDWDLCTSALPEQTRRCFSGVTVLDTGLRHGTVTIVLGQTPFEVTTYRVDSQYTDHRRPDEVRFTTDLAEDLARRDFTMNAIAIHPDGTLIDPFGGEADIRRGCIRCVGEPGRRFSEDALRILRALRFSAQLQFEIEAETARAIHANRCLLAFVSPERISGELAGLLPGSGAGRVLSAFSDVVAQIIPELAPAAGCHPAQPGHRDTLYAHIVRSIDACAPELVPRLALLYLGTGKPHFLTQDAQEPSPSSEPAAVSAALARTSLTALRFDAKTIDQVTQLISHHDAPLQPTAPSVRRWLGKLGPEQFLRLIQVQQADIAAQDPPVSPVRAETLQAVRRVCADVLASGLAYRLSDIAVSGRDLLALGIPPGPQLGRLLQQLLDQVIDGRLENQKDALLAYARAAMPPDPGIQKS